jgi:thiamine biosynthesis lipoprotein
MPSQADIQQALAQVGHSRLLHWNDSQKTLQKSHPDVSINLSAIAKGYGVDQVAGYLAATDITRYLVEIGGDLVTAGLNPEGKPWSIGIETPDALTQTVQTIVKLSGQAMATSGDYRNFFEQDGVRYSHIINATTGWPIRHRTASVTVLAETAMAADGWATAMLSLGQAAGMELAEQHQIAVLFITKDEKKFIINTSSHFETLTDIGM